MLTRRRRLLGTQDRNLWFWVFVGPFFLGLLVFVYVQILWSIWLIAFAVLLLKRRSRTITPVHSSPAGSLAQALG